LPRHADGERDHQGRSALVYVLQPDGPVAQQIFELLLAAGTDLAAPDELGDTPLHDALGWLDDAEHVANVARLLDAGAPIEARNARGQTPLHVACEAPPPWAWQAVQLLLARGADPTTRDATGSSPLHFLACWGHTEGAALLLDAGLSPDVVERDTGLTPLHYACGSGCYALADLLLSRGALDQHLLAAAAGWPDADDALPLRRVRWTTDRGEPVLGVERGGASLARIDRHAEIVEVLEAARRPAGDG
jgi:ankyrin repeat protein